VSASTRSWPRAAARWTASKITALSAPVEVGAGPVGPGLELLGGGGAERVAGGHHDGAAVSGLLGAELADGGGLADAVDAHEEPHVGRPLGARLEVDLAVQAGQAVLHLVLEGVEQRLGVGDLLGPDAVAQPVEQGGAEADADIGPE
jgi:hypothetical protein